MRSGNAPTGGLDKAAGQAYKRCEVDTPAHHPGGLAETAALDAYINDIFPRHVAGLVREMGMLSRGEQDILGGL